MWNEKELLDQLENYFNKTTKEQFFRDVKDVGCEDFIEEVTEEAGDE